MQAKIFNATPYEYPRGWKFLKKYLSDRLYIFLAIIITISTFGCDSEDSSKRFQLISSEQSGIDFSNDLQETADFNFLNYLYFYDGGGVSIGDINNDGLSDLYFTANMLPNRLYLNQGNFEFLDITPKAFGAGVSGDGDWTSGTTMADVNGDGLLDIYISNVNYLSKKGHNQLFINNGDSTFTEQAAEYGLDFKGYSKHASFFDYDNDGDLDLYLLNHAIHSEKTYTRAENRTRIDSLAGDRLYKNNNGRFIDVSQEAGIYSSPMGYGLAVTVSDINTDGCPDIYVSNDFHENDYLYRNNCDGTFNEVLEEATGHTSRASMGNDIADINNDLRPDVFVLDMLPYEENILKTSSSIESYKVFKIQRNMGYHPQYNRNTLQLNLGSDQNGNLLFSEIGQYAGVHATDWSWASLLLDINNNGLKDLVITNGIYRRPNDLGYLARVGSDNVQESLNRGINSENMSLVEMMPHVKIPNFVFSNNGDLTFSKMNSRWGLSEAGYSSGMAYADLDNDGDLDLVINNVDSPASVYRNMTRERNEGNYLKIKLQGKGENSFGVGSKILVWNNEHSQIYEQILTRGFLSSVEPDIIVGLDTLKTADSLTVVWPDKSYQTLKEVQTNQTLTIDQQDASGRFSFDDLSGANYSETYFMDVTGEEDITFRHQEDSFTDFDRQILMPHMLSSEGPRIATGDVNGDGLDDFYIGGAKYQSGNLFVQQKDGSFTKTNDLTFRLDAQYEDIDAQFFDANGDGAPDLYVVSGGNEYSSGYGGLEDRIYFNDGEGNFARIYNALPQIFENGSTVAAADYNGDGDTDLFIGNRSVPQQYGVTPRSYLLENTGKGHFREVTARDAPDLADVGMVTDAVWEDVNGNGYSDLIVVGEWMPITILENGGGKLKRSTAPGLKATDGWWNRLKSGDFDGDGDTDFIAGNVGLNTFFQATEDQPLVMYLKDFNEDGKLDPVIGYTKKDGEYPVAVRDELLLPFKFLRSKFPAYRDYAGSTIQDIFGNNLDGAEKKEIYMMQSVLLDNSGDGNLRVEPLPDKAQFAPIYAIEADDFNSDGNLDLLVAGNFYPVKPAVGGRYDASYGWFLKGNGDGNFTAVEPEKSGFIIRGQARDIGIISKSDSTSLILTAINNEDLKLFINK